ncbi:hypothetical protein KPL37_11680 [Clostridium frigoris]|uniref:ABC-2 type transport system permease protein n=1 Tax=Clostridium frigoris TaxID=205327 RepID=A0ABS6BU15_9CLOT|nr:hypothetical protein [Clostridium frigoris]MBU3160406.1 hypothetical protein [Clostridium frigoris]
MKNSTLILLKAQFLNQSGVNTFRYENDKNKKNKMVIFAFAMTITVIMMVVYCFMMAYGLGSIGLSGIIPGYAFTITSLIVMLFTIFKASGTLFAFKDYDMLMSLPVKTTTVITSRFLLMYEMNVLFCILVMLPMGTAYGMFAHPQILFYVLWVISIFVTPLVPMTIAAALGAIISAISSKFKHTNMINIILSFVVTIGFMGASMSAGTMSGGQINIKQLASLGTMLTHKMNQIYPLVSIFEKGVCQYNIIAFISFLVISVIWYFVFVKVVSIKYKAINTGLTSHQTKSNYKLKSSKVTSTFRALHRKEIKRFFSSYLYVLNVGMGAVLLLALSITCFIFGIDKLQRLMGIPNIKGIMTNFAPFVMSGMLAMTCTTSVSLSLEGKNLWILLSAPIEAATIYRSKMAVNITLLLPVSLLSSILMKLCLKPSIMSTVWMFITPLAYVGLTSVWGIYINLKFPNFEWESEVTVIKQSIASLFGILGGMLFGFIPMVILLILPGIDRNLIMGVITLLVIGITSILYIKVCGTKLPK